MWPYPLINRNSQEILIASRKYLLCFGKRKKIQTDNAYVYRSSVINNFCIEDITERVFLPHITLKLMERNKRLIKLAKNT